MVTKEQFQSPYYNLKQLIRNSGKTQADMADMLGIDRSTFNLKVNRSGGRDFTFEEAIELSRILNKKIEYFF